ncbi:MAG: amidohydrolase family protein [Lachnospiraceae bacterium]|nr:amidohydrolase family protein [Lachnospiraceae bacterium]
MKVLNSYDEFMRLADGMNICSVVCGWKACPPHLSELRNTGWAFACRKEGILVYYECHMHMFMNGRNYREAVALHRNGVNEEDIRNHLEAYARAGVTYLRDGGDNLGVSARTVTIAPEYGIEYRTPIFAIHKNGHYGGIVGRGFDTMKEYHDLIKEAAAAGADFIKIMVSGILDFTRGGALTEESLDREEIREMVHIAHEEGFAVMAHTNGADAVRAVIDAGIDSIEHGNFMDEECLQALCGSSCIWVPTFVTITNLIGSGRYDDESLTRLKREQGERIRKGFALGASIAPGSDAGAFRVPHAQGILDEYRELYALCADQMTREEFDRKIERAAEELKLRFTRK